MKNILIGIGIGVMVTGLGVVLLKVLQTGPCIDEDDIITFPGLPSLYTTLTEPEARALAEASCIKGGETLGEGSYNPNSKTWWFDANLNATQPGCNPACVVFEETRTSEINWRCTGLIPPEAEVPGTLPPSDGNPPATSGPLTGTWVFVSGTQADGSIFMPTRPDAFTLTFNADASVSIGTDCNSMGGGYETSGSRLSFGNLFSTMMYCEGSYEGQFSQMLAEVTSYRIIEGGTLVLEQEESALNLTFGR